MNNSKSAITIVPRCCTFFCESYFTVDQIIQISLIFIRILMASIILGFGIKIPKDFLKTITVGIFLPILIASLLMMYIELANFANEFQSSTAFYGMFVQWTHGFSSILADYIHVNSLSLHILSLYCARLALNEDQAVLQFPTRMVVCLVQTMPLFLCLLTFVPITNPDSFILRAIGILNKLFYFISFISFVMMIVWCLRGVRRELPYDHARHSDVQVRDARSRLIFLLLFLLIPFLSLVPFFADSILRLIILINGESEESRFIASKFEYIEVEIKSYSSIWLAILTLLFIPPYRRTLLLLLPFKKIRVEPLPRKEVDLTNMYRYANLEEAIEAT